MPIGRSAASLNSMVRAVNDDVLRDVQRMLSLTGLPIVATKARAKVPETGCKFPSSVDVQRVSTVLWQSAALMAPVGRAALFASQDVIDWMSSQLVMRLDDRK